MNYNIDLEKDDIDILSNYNFEKDQWGHICTFCFVLCEQGLRKSNDLDLFYKEFGHCKTLKEIFETWLEVSELKNHVIVNTDNINKLITITASLGNFDEIEAFDNMDDGVKFAFVKNVNGVTRIETNLDISNISNYTAEADFIYNY